MVFFFLFSYLMNTNYWKKRSSHVAQLETSWHKYLKELTKWAQLLQNYHIKWHIVSFELCVVVAKSMCTMRKLWKGERGLIAPGANSTHLWSSWTNTKPDWLLTWIPVPWLKLEILQKHYLFISRKKHSHPHSYPTADRCAASQLQYKISFQLILLCYINFQRAQHNAERLRDSLALSA